MTTFTMAPTEETCWLHRYVMLYWVEMSNGIKDLYCPDCGGPSHPQQR